MCELKFEILAVSFGINILFYLKILNMYCLSINYN